MRLLPIMATPPATTAADRQLSPASLRQRRSLFVIGGIVYLVWWFMVEALLPHAFNPLSSRLAVCALFAFFLVLSFVSSYARRHLVVLYGIASTVLTLHYYYLFLYNSGDINWVIGAFITVLAVGVTLDTFAVSLTYSAIVILATYYVSYRDTSNAVVMPGIATALVVINLVAFVREKADREKSRRIDAEAERAAAEAISRAKSLFLANISHELRTPLTGILGFSELLSFSEHLSAEERLMLERLRAQSRVLKDLVEQILSLTEENVVQLQASSETLDIRQLIQDRVQALQTACQAKGIGLSVFFEEPFVDRIFGDRLYIQRIIDNVLGNALKFSSKGVIQVFAREMPSETSDELDVVVTVRDSGIGIDKGHWDKVFDPFRQLHEGYHRPFGGTGVGLSVARKLARAMGGDVVIAESALQQGTTVRIVIRARLANSSSN